MFDKYNLIFHQQLISNMGFVDYESYQKTTKIVFFKGNKEKNELTVSTSNANIRLADVSGLYEGFTCLKCLNGL
jgi:hypothetical protein